MTCVDSDLSRSLALHMWTQLDISRFPGSVCVPFSSAICDLSSDAKFLRFLSTRRCHFPQKYGVFYDQVLFCED